MVYMHNINPYCEILELKDAVYIKIQQGLKKSYLLYSTGVCTMQSSAAIPLKSLTKSS